MREIPLTIGPYTVLREIGRGGMGVVYLARDTRLDRDVAIKCLPNEFALDSDRLVRFEREAKTLASLNHPNIATIHGLEEVDGKIYLVLEFLDGVTLRDRFPQNGVPWRKCLEVTLGIADALAAAHAKGIVHRDIKPDNVMILPDGRVKVLDFGLARVGPLPRGATDSETIDVNTEPGVVMGTLGYVSPEQARGHAADSRSDIFSFGCVLYELLAGTPPFLRDTRADSLAATLTDEPSELTDLDSTVPAGVARLVRRCLEKQPEQRFQAARDLAYSLREVLTESPRTVAPRGVSWRRSWTIVLACVAIVGIAAFAILQRSRSNGSDPTISTLVVLPLEIDDARVDVGYLADEIPASIIDNLTTLRALRVIPRDTAFRYRDRPDGAAAIGRELDADYVLTGRILKPPGGVRVRAELIDVVTNHQTWSQHYDRSLDNTAAVEKEIIAQIVESLRIRMTGETQARLERRWPADPEAHTLYLQGRYWLNRRNPDGFQRAIESFDRALAVDHQYTLALVGKADCYALLGFYLGPPSEYFPRAKRTAETALALDDELAEAHTSLGMARMMHDWDWAGAEASFRRAIALSDRFATAHLWYGIVLGSLGRTEQALSQIKQAHTLDPGSSVINMALGLGYSCDGQDERSLRQFQACTDMAPNFGPTYEALGRVHVANGRYGKAMSAFRRAVELTSSDSARAGLAWCYAQTGRDPDARSIQAELERRSNDRFVSAYAIAVIQAGLWEADQAFAWLERAEQNREFRFTRLRRSPFFASYRGDPRYAEMVYRCGLEPLPATMPAKAPSPVVLLVLPFENRSRDPGVSFLADEIPASIIDSVSTLANLHVVPRASAFRFREMVVDLRVVGAQMHADYILTGQIHRSGKSLHLRAELVDVKDDRQQWSERYDRAADDTLAIERELTDRIVEVLKVEVTGEEQAQLVGRRPAHPEAHAAYLEGRFWWNRRSETGIDRSIEFYKKALKIDPDYALAYAGLADSYCTLGWAYRDPNDVFPKARDAAEKSLEIDPNLAEAYPPLGWVRAAYDWDFAGAEKAFQKAIELSPRNPHAHSWRAFHLFSTDRIDDALASALRARELDPGSLIINSVVGLCYYLSRDFEAARVELERVRKMDPTFFPAWQMLGDVYTQLERFDDAIEIFEELYASSGRVPANSSGLGVALALAGREADAREELRILMETAKTRYIPPSSFALIHATLRDIDQAFAYLDEAFEKRDRFLAYLSVSPLFETLRGDPRFNELIRRIGLTPGDAED